MTHFDSAALSAEIALRTFVLDFKNDPRWDAFVATHPHAIIYHSSNWLTALEEEYGEKCISLACEDHAGRVRAVLPLFQTRGLPFAIGQNPAGPRLSSLPRTPVSGPLALDSAAATEVMRAAVALARKQGLQLEIKSQIKELDKPVDGLRCVPWRPTYVEELPPSGPSWQQFCENIRLPRNCGPCKGCRRLRFGNAKQQHRINWAVNKAIRLGLVVREADKEEDLANWYELYLQTMRHKAIPPRSFRFFSSLWSTLRPHGQMRLLLAEQARSGHRHPIAGSVFLKFGQTVFYAFTGCAPRNLCLHPHDLIQLEAIRDACKCGFRWYDFGEVTEDNGSLAQFKEKWGTVAMPLFRYYSPVPKDRPHTKGGLITSTRKLWRFLPQTTTAVLGDWIYRYM